MEVGELGKRATDESSKVITDESSKKAIDRSSDEHSWASIEVLRVILVRFHVKVMDCDLMWSGSNDYVNINNSEAKDNVAVMYTQALRKSA